MNRISLRQLAATMILAAPALLTSSFAAEPAIDAPPPKPYTVPAKAKDYIAKAVQSPSRPAAMTVHDAYRKPAEVLQLAGLRPGQRVIELSSYGNYWSTMVSDILGPKGELYMYDHPFAAPVAKVGEDFVKAHPNTHFQNIDHNLIEFPKGVDVVLCILCFHELLLTNTQMDPFLAKLYKSLKPGGIILVVFPTARDGMENRDTGALHRIDPATVRGTIGGASFELIEENRMLENSSDDKKSPVMTEAEGDLCDRLIYKFRKS